MPPFWTSNIRLKLLLGLQRLSAKRSEGDSPNMRLPLLCGLTSVHAVVKRQRRSQFEVTFKPAFNKPRVTQQLDLRIGKISQLQSSDTPDFGFVNWWIVDEDRKVAKKVGDLGTMVLPEGADAIEFSPRDKAVPSTLYKIDVSNPVVYVQKDPVYDPAINPASRTFYPEGCNYFAFV
jgi:hypothetical protein